MFLVVDRDEARGAALVAALGARGMAAGAFHDTFSARAALGRDRPEAVVVALDGLDGAAVGQLVGHGAVFGAPMLDPLLLAAQPVLFTGGRRGTVFRTFRACWSLGYPFRWREGASPDALATWAAEEAKQPRPPARPPRTPAWFVVLLLVVVAPLLAWSLLGGRGDLLSLAFLPVLLVANGLQSVPPVVAAARRRVPISPGAWLVVTGLLFGVAVVVSGLALRL